MKKIVSNSRDKTIKLGRKIGRLLVKGNIVALSGEFGSGKTTMIKGIAGGLGVKKTRYVNSPSFVIVKEYRGRLPVYHFDIHRLDDVSDLDTIGYKDLFYGEGVSLIEWADKIQGSLPLEYLSVSLSIKSDISRFIELHGVGAYYEKLVERIKLQ